MRGLSQQDAEIRLATHGPNVIPARHARSTVGRFLAQFNNILIYILMASAVVTGLLQHWVDTAVIAAVIISNAFIGFIQEGKAEDALAAIRRLLSPYATVLRDGKRIRLDAALLVPGDTVLLAAGDKVPADLRLVAASQLRAQEAILTGESLEVEKEACPAGAEQGSARQSTAFSGTLITSGSGTGIVTATGLRTEIGRISASVNAVESPETPLTVKLSRLFRHLAVMIILSSAGAFLFGVYIRHLPVEDMFMVMIGIAVSSIPEGLPAAISITLAMGVRLMAQRNAIVRQIPVIETLGNTTVVCTDKTGTLTYNELAVSHVVTAEHSFTVSGVGYTPDGKFLLAGQEIELGDYPAAHQMLHGAVLNNDASLQLREDTWVLHGDPTEGALMAFALKAGHTREKLHAEFPRTGLLPFSAEQRYMATLHSLKGSDSIIYVKGAPEKLLDMCDRQMDGAGKARKLQKDYWHGQIGALARKGERVLALAFKRIDSSPDALRSRDVESGLLFLGLFGITDKPRAEAAPAIAQCRRAGVAVKMITGDHLLTAAAIGHEIGIEASDRVLTGAEIDTLSDIELDTIAEKVNIYARMFPEHKLRLVKALQRRGHVVAMTGDGVNDAPALKAADIGIAMGIQGTEVAKDASKLVLADDNFATIAHAIEEGRNIYKNLRYTIQFMLVTDFAEGLSLLIALLAGWALPVTPLQILWVNTVTAITLSLSFAFAPHHKDAMAERPRSARASFFSVRQVASMAFHVALISLGTIVLFLYETQATGEVVTARTMAVNTLIGFQVYYLWGLFPPRSGRSAGWLRHYAPVLLATLGIVLAQALFCYTPWMQAVFITAPLNLLQWGTIVMVTSVIFVWIKIERLIPRLLPAAAHLKSS
jgi:magnesium-transporting ATPase (P-type)